MYMHIHKPTHPHTPTGFDTVTLHLPTACYDLGRAHTLQIPTRTTVRGLFEIIHSFYHKTSVALSVLE